MHGPLGGPCMWDGKVTMSCYLLGYTVLGGWSVMDDGCVVGREEG